MGTVYQEIKEGFIVQRGDPRKEHRKSTSPHKLCDVGVV